MNICTECVHHRNPKQDPDLAHRCNHIDHKLQLVLDPVTGNKRPFDGNEFVYSHYPLCRDHNGDGKCDKFEHVRGI